MLTNKKTTPAYIETANNTTNDRTTFSISIPLLYIVSGLVYYIIHNLILSKMPDADCSENKGVYETERCTIFRELWELGSVLEKEHPDRSTAVWVLEWCSNYERYYIGFHGTPRNIERNIYQLILNDIAIYLYEEGLVDCSEELCMIVANTVSSTLGYNYETSLKRRSQTIPHAG